MQTLTRLNERTIAGLKPTGTQYDIADAGPDRVRGLLLKVSRDASAKDWTVRIRISGGRRRRHTIGRHGQAPTVTVADARRLAAEAIERARSTGSPAPPPTPARLVATGPTFADLADRYLAERLPELKPSTASEHRRRLETHLRPAWQHRAAASLRYADVRAITQPLVAATPIEARRLFQLISAIFAWSLRIDVDPSIEANPCAGRPQPGRAETPRERVLTDAELARLVRASVTHGATTEHPSIAAKQTAAAALARLELLTGQRGAELQRMRWSDLTDEPDGVLWTIPGADTKNGDPHRVPLSDQVVAILDGRGRRQPARRASSTWVFPSRDGDAAIVRPHKGIRALYRAAGLPTGAGGVTRHDLRRTLATRLGAAGVAPDVIGRILNHRPAGSRVTAIYNVYRYLPEMRAALQTWADTLDGLVGVTAIRRRA